MSAKLQSTTESFDAATAERKFVYIRNNAQVTIETSSENDLSLCKSARSILDSLDYGAGPAAHNTIAGLLSDSEKKTPPLPLSITLELKSPPAPVISSVFEIIAPPTAPAKIESARSLTDYDISREYGGTQYADNVRNGCRLVIS